jgi:anti-sigma regulatory factor (Ser/Thr protein kinase)
MSEPTYGSGGARGISFPAVGAAVTDARVHVTRWLRAAGDDQLMIDDVGLAVSEACTNAVVHAYRDREADGSDDPRFSIVTERDQKVVTVTVSDEGCGMVPRTDSPGLGMGVSLIAALSDRVLVGTQPDGSGTVVAMSFTAAGSRGRRLAL